MSKMKTSKMWDSLVTNRFAKVDDLFLANFRQPGNANNRLEAWDPYDKTMRYFKFFSVSPAPSEGSEFFFRITER